MGNTAVVVAANRMCERVDVLVGATGTKESWGGLPPGLSDYMLALSAAAPAGTPAPPPPTPIRLSDEQQALLDAVATGRDVIVDATVGSGKTSSIQALCSAQEPDRRVLYLTYSKLLKIDAQRRVRGAKVQNYHGIVYPSLLAGGISCGIGESIRRFNETFLDFSADFPRYDLLVIDEYQDITEEYAQLLANIKSVNPLMQTVMVGDMAQKLRSDTTLDVQNWAKGFCVDPQLLPFTQSFRIGPKLAELLGEAWNKPIVGVNDQQRLRVLDYDDAVELIASSAPGDLLCLGKRNGAMSRALNTVEERRPDVFNKETVFASIRDSDAGVSYGDDAAVFTTFDSSKGLERPVSVVFDYDEANWDVRNKFPNADPTILRNVFLVAASRGKDEVIFVRGDRSRRTRAGANIGFIPVHRFVDLPAKSRPEYKDPLWVSQCFDFTYAENLQACVDLLSRKRLDDGAGEVIELERTDALIDLSPAVGHYQEAIFFEDYDARVEVERNPSKMAGVLAEELTEDDMWRNALVLTAVDTEQLRYVDQVEATVPGQVEGEIVDRLGTLLPRDCRSQIPMVLAGEAMHDALTGTPLQFTGVADVIHDEVVYELKFVTELSHAMFLQLAMYLVMSGRETGVLWNTRTDERWEVRVPDRARFLNAVVLCVTKQNYGVFRDSGQAWLSA